MKVVFDTNIFISAFVIPGSQGERASLLAVVNASTFTLRLPS